MRKLTADQTARKTCSSAPMLTSAFLVKCSVTEIITANLEMTRRTAMELATTKPGGVLHLRPASQSGSIAMESAIAKMAQMRKIVIARAALPLEICCARARKETAPASASPRSKFAMEFLIALTVSMKKVVQELASLIRLKYLTMKLKLFAQMADHTTRNTLAPELSKLAMDSALNATPNQPSPVEKVVVVSRKD